VPDIFLIRSKEHISKVTETYEITDSTIESSINANKPLLLDFRKSPRTQFIGFLHTFSNKISSVIVYPIVAQTILLPSQKPNYTEDFKQRLINSLFNLYKYSINETQVRIIPFEIVLEKLMPDNLVLSRMTIKLNQSKKVNMRVIMHMELKNYCNHISSREFSTVISIEELADIDELTPAINKKINVPLKKIEGIVEFGRNNQDIWEYFNISSSKWSITDINKISTILNSNIDIIKLNDLLDDSDNKDLYYECMDLITHTRSKMEPEKAKQNNSMSIACSGVSLTLSRERFEVNMAGNSYNDSADPNAVYKWFTYINYMKKVCELMSKLKRITLLNI